MNRLPALPAIAIALTVAVAVARDVPFAFAQDASEHPFRQRVNPKIQKLENVFDLTGLSIPRKEIHTLLAKDAIASLTDPPLRSGTEISWLQPDDRILVARDDKQVIGVPIRVLNRHEVVNLKLSGEPIAITYCPLCDSGTIFKRTVLNREGEPKTLEFGVSGSLYNSNVLIYDRQTKGLWSQLAMKCVSGPFLGRHLEMLPVRVMTLEHFSKQFPDGKLTAPAGRTYRQNAYARYFSNDGLIVSVRRHGKQLPRKTLGIGIATDENSWFIQATDDPNELSIQTERGDVKIARGRKSLAVLSAPEGIHSAQSFYYAWTAFYPDTEIVGLDE